MGGRLDGKIAIVTGGGQGIGRGIALALAGEGAAVTVTVTGRMLAKLGEVVKEITAIGGRALAASGDAGSRGYVVDWVDTTVAEFGTMDILVNNAQSPVRRSLEKTTDADIETAFCSGTLGTFYAMQACLPYLKRRGGSIVNFGSPTAVTGDPAFGAYAVAKEAIRGLTKVSAREWGRYGVRVNVICPAALSPAAESFAGSYPERFAAVIGETSLGRLGDPEADIGRAVAALVSDDLRYLTDATLLLDGEPDHNQLT
jgi:NAD(P)-dependent dehydrogenase (short-subunit alcohol dehydrogenase family)